MNQTGRPNISVIEPIGLAINRTRDILFRPFDVGKWFVIGFCAFLAMLGEAGGGPGNFGSGGNGGNGHGGGFPSGSEIWSSVVPYLPFIIIGVMVGLTIGIGLAVVFAWLRGRGQFMFLDCIAKNVAHVVKPWHEYRPEGNSIFRLYLVLLLVFGGLMLLLVGFGLVGVLLSLAAGRAGVVIAILIGAVCMLFIIPLAILSALISGLTRYFVVPIMYIERIEWRPAWSRLWNLIRQSPGPFVLWVLLLFAINMAIGLAIGILVLVSFCLCCIGCCIVPIACLPYINAVVMLPLHVFRRTYALCFLAQFGPQYDVFAVQPQTGIEVPQILT
jgi:hypothetical protein